MPNYDMFTHKLGSAHACNLSFIGKMKAFSRSQAVTFTSEVVVSQKRC